MSVSIVIPTYNRGEILLDTVRTLLSLRDPASEVLVVDQTAKPDPSVLKTMTDWGREGKVRWIRLPRPSIPHAMNVGLQSARCPLVLFLDDDIVPCESLVRDHRRAHDEEGVAAVVGQVLQPGETPHAAAPRPPAEGLLADLDFPFWSTGRARVSNVMAGNLSVKREQALAAGGFDENFEGSAYRFESEFCRRLLRTGGAVLFEPKASIRHLRLPSGGTRSSGSHLTSASPRHGVGDYYFALREGGKSEAVRYSLRRMRREVCTRFHLRHPWYIPIKLIGELRALLWALRMQGLGPRHVNAAAAADAGGNGEPAMPPAADAQEHDRTVSSAAP